MTDTSRTPAHLIDLIRRQHPGTERPSVLIAAFEGWNDAGDAATETLEEVVRQLGAEQIDTIADDEYYDYQVHRPSISRSTAGASSIQWPQTRVLHAEYASQAQRPEDEANPVMVDAYFMAGIEPSFRWKTYTQELLQTAKNYDVQAIILVGSLLADVPHSRPLTPKLTSGDPVVKEELGAAASTYEGPTGIVGVIADAASAAGMPTVSVWVAVPHYVAHSPSPKAQLGLLKQVEELLQVSLDLHQIRDEAAAWERGVDELASDDPEVAAYIRRLEETRDTEDLPEASGESIAREFERYLKRREDNPPRGRNDE